MAMPIVSVAIPVYNAVAYLDECLTSIAAQTIGFDAIEVVAVNDGSTDDSGAKLDEWAEKHPNIRVLHQANSGGPGGPRNRAIDASRGEYLFFADPDDHLGPEAFERMLAVARRNDSDIVLGRIRGVGRRAADRPFRRAVEQGDVASTDAVWSLTAHKLFRRSLIVDNGLRFAEGVRLAEEQPLVVPAYFLAKTISVVADYDCYYLMYRPGGGHLTRAAVDPAPFFAIVRDSVQTVVEETKPGPDRDLMLRRWAQVEILGRFGRKFADLPARTRKQCTQRAAAILIDLIPAEVFDPLPAMDRVRGALVRLGRPDELARLARFDHSGARTAPVIEDGRVYAGYPYFRDPRYGIPDRCYDITDKLALDHCPVRVTRTPQGLLRVHWQPTVPALQATDLAWSLVLQRDDGAECVAAALRTADGAEATMDLRRAHEGAPLPDGCWVAYTHVTDGRRQARLAIGEHGTAEDHPGLGPILAGDTPIDVSLAQGRLIIEAGAAIRPRAELSPTGLTWQPGRRARLTLTAHSPWPVAGEPTLYLTRGAGGPELTVPATQEPAGMAPGVAIRAELDPLALAHAGLGPGRWQCTLGPAGAAPDRRAPVSFAQPSARRTSRSTLGRPLWSLLWLEPAGKRRILTLVVADWRHLAQRANQRGRHLLARLRHP